VLQRCKRVRMARPGSMSAGRTLTTVRAGYTLIEVMLVLVIIGILATLAVVHIAETKQHAYVATMQSDLNNLEEAEEAYFVEFNTYTPTMPVDRYMPSTNDTYSITTADFTGWSAVVTRLNDTGMGVTSCHLASGTAETTATEWPGAPNCP
jgi:prepilin-type N-terminal cleavage/methylation domain-containing protein